MGFWLTVGKLAATAGARGLTTYVRRRLESKAIKARREGDLVEDALFWAGRRKKEREEQRERGRAAR